LKYSHINYAHYGKLYPQNAERILTIDSVTLVHPMYIHLFQRLGRRKQARKQTTRKIEKKHRKNTYLASNLIIRQLTNNLSHMLTSVKKLLLPYAAVHMCICHYQQRVPSCFSSIIHQMRLYDLSLLLSVQSHIRCSRDVHIPHFQDLHIYCLSIVACL